MEGFLKLEVEFIDAALEDFGESVLNCLHFFGEKNQALGGGVKTQFFAGYKVLFNFKSEIWSEEALS